jgi:tetratricopeptide (TPR) repeat protein
MSLFISYSSKDKSYAEEIDSKLSRYGVTLIRDERDLKPLASIKEFMQEIKDSDYAVCLISDNYLKSPNCLYEFNEFLKVADSKERLMPVLLPGTKFSDDKYAVFVAQGKEADRLKTKQKKQLLVSAIREWFSPKKPLDNSQFALFNKAWEYLTGNKCFGYNDIAGKSFKDVFSFVGVYEEKVWDEAARIKKIADSQEREIAYEKLMQQYPEGFATLYNRAAVCDDNKEYKLAEFYYQEFLKKFPGPEDQVMGLYGLGLTYTHMENYQQAIKCHMGAISLNPGAWKSYQGLGDIYIKQNRNQEALDSYKAAYNIVKDAGPALGIGCALYNLADFKGAKEFLSESARLNPDNRQTQEFLKSAQEKSMQVQASPPRKVTQN